MAKPLEPRTEVSDTITTADLAKLETMSKEALIGLIERMARQCGIFANMTEDEIRQAFMDRMAHIALTGKALEALAAMDKRMNRSEGTPIQRQQSMVAIAEANNEPRIIEIIHVKP